MKYLILVVLAGIMFASCAPQIYQARNFETIKQTQEVIAVLPFDASFDLHRLPKGVKGGDIDKALFHTSYSVQKHAYYYLLDKSYIKRLNIRLQDIRLTNEILEESGISFEEMILMDKGELCKELGVDGVISGNIRMSRPMSDGAALVAGVFAGVWGATNETHMTMTIHNKQNSQLLWRYSFQARGAIGSSSQGMTRRLIRNVARHFPYNNL